MGELLLNHFGLSSVIYRKTQKDASSQNIAARSSNQVILAAQGLLFSKGLCTSRVGLQSILKDHFGRSHKTANLKAYFCIN